MYYIHIVKRFRAHCGFYAIENKLLLLFYVITAAQKSRTTATRHEVYANLDIVCADKPGVYDLELKVDTGSSGNTLPVHIARQMYGEMWRSKKEHMPNVKLTAHNGGEIECCSVLKILCRYRDCQWR